jgi:hypothetical protein
VSKVATFKTAQQLSIDDVLIEFEAESHNGICPYTQRCEKRRANLPIYRPGQPCHWVAWGDWERCPIYQNGGAR